MPITRDQIRAARALKNWSQTDLAERTGLAVPTIANIELGKQDPGQNTVAKIIDAFETAGIEFIGERGVQKRTDTSKVYRGVEGLSHFYRDIYETLRDAGGEVMVANVDERQFIKELRPADAVLHMNRMRDLKHSVQYKILVKEGDTYFVGSEFATYRWTPAEDFQSIPFYVYGHKLAIILWLDEPVVFVLESEESASVYREKFLQLWKKSKTPKGQDKNSKEFVIDSVDDIERVQKKYMKTEKLPVKKGRT